MNQIRTGVAHNSGPRKQWMCKKIQLKNIVKIENGYLNRSRIEPNPNGPFRLIQLRDFNKEKSSLNIKDLIYFKPGSIKPEQIIQKSDVLYLAKGTNNFAFYPHKTLPPQTVASSYFYVLRPTSDVLPEYLVWFFNHPYTRAMISRLAGSGVRVPVIRKPVLGELKIPLPPLEEQQHIIDLHSTVIEEAKLLDKLMQTRKTLMDEITMSIANRKS